ncbi:MAG: transglycosylase domain-containing protein [Clostridia bacterium]|nr:transglycosylase domain-containing protein [Clostridia bacterium]
MFQKIARQATKGVLCALLGLLVTATIFVVTVGVYAGVGLDTELDAVFFTSGADRTTRLYYTDKAGNMVELVDDRISGSENALYCSFDEIPTDLKNAFIAIEDKRFYDHGGIDWGRTLSATWDLVRGGERHFGGSTITQQLVKNITGENERSVQRKLKELIRAAKLEKRLSKDQILEQYLNVVNLARNCYGVRTAANAYFSKEPIELSLAECATIAAITNNPTKYDPIHAPEENRARRDLILKAMLEQGMISEQAFQEASTTATHLTPNEKAFSGRTNSWFADLVVKDVINDLVKVRGMTTGAASQLLYCGGLKICTTVDPELQEILEAHYADGSNFPTHSDGRKAQSAMMIADPDTGDILAIVGAVGEKRGNRIQNYAIDAKRPSGSVIKPLSVFAPALEKGLITWSTVFDDVPKQFRSNGAPWPRNSPNLYRGLTNVSAALTHSINTVSVSVLERLGCGSSYRFLSQTLGFSSLDPVLDTGTAALALGQQQNGVTLIELMGGYTALANGGIYSNLRSYETVTDQNDNVLLSKEITQHRALERDNAAIMTMLLRQVTRQGTAKSMTLTEQVDVAGKTGTSSNNCDKWFIGYTPELLAGVWYGYEYPESLSDVKGNPALATFDAVMNQVLSIRPAKKRQLDTEGDLVAVRYCKDSGRLMSEACQHDPRGDRSEIGYFKRGTQPTEQCQCHVLISYCSQGGVACENCPPEECQYSALLRISRSFPRQVKVLDAPYTYGGPVIKKEHHLTNNEPYYVENDRSKRNVGVGMDVIPYNRLCPFHSCTDNFWRRRQGERIA